MTHERIFGLQWRLTAVSLVAGICSPALAAGGYLAGTALGLNPSTALAAGAAAGVILGLAAAAACFIIARSVKLRLWEAGRMAGLIARGDLKARLRPGPPDELGWLEERLNLMAGHLETAVGQLRHLAEENRLLGEEAGRGAALEERARLARDLHDTVNQQLFALAMRLAAIRRRLDESGKIAAAEMQELDALETLARQAHSQTRELIMQLRPVSLEQQGLGAALHEYVTGAASREGWEVELDIDRSVRPGAEVEECLFRIAQEVLNNTAKHARAGCIRVELARVSEGILLSIADDGIGFDTHAAFRPTSVGLRGIRERAAAVGGLCRIESAPGRGTEITVTVPMEKGEVNR